jgi:hypothetical protein
MGGLLLMVGMASAVLLIIDVVLGRAAAVLLTAAIIAGTWRPGTPCECWRRRRGRMMFANRRACQ